MISFLKKNKLLLGSLIFYIIVITAFFCYKYIDNINSTKKTQLIMRNIFESCVNYLNEYGAFESNETNKIYEALRGSNKKEIVFLSSVTGQNMSLDAWGSVIQITIIAGEIKLISSGPNRLYEEGNSDDIIFKDNEFLINRTNTQTHH